MNHWSDMIRYLKCDIICKRKGKRYKKTSVVCGIETLLLMHGVERRTVSSRRGTDLSHYDTEKNNKPNFSLRDERRYFRVYSWKIKRLGCTEACRCQKDGETVMSPFEFIGSGRIYTCMHTCITNQETLRKLSFLRRTLPVPWRFLSCSPPLRCFFSFCSAFPCFLQLTHIYANHSDIILEKSLLVAIYLVPSLFGAACISSHIWITRHRQQTGIHELISPRSTETVAEKQQIHADGVALGSYKHEFHRCKDIRAISLFPPSI